LLGPAVLVASGKRSRRGALLLAMALFGLGNLLCAVAPNLPVLLAGRVLMGMGAVFTPIAAGITVALVEPQRRGKALAHVFLGISLSYVIGMPLGAWLGLTFGWRWPIALVAALTLPLLGLVARSMPREVDGPRLSLAGLGTLLGRAEVLSPLALTLLYFTAIFCVFSYIGPVLQALNPMSGTMLSITLALFGLAGALGTLWGGWANDHLGTKRALATNLTALAATMLLVPLTAGHYALTVAVFTLWGIAGFGLMAPQQARLAAAAAAQAPLAFSLNTSMLYAGTAIGAAVGGPASAAVGFERLSWVGVPFALAGLATLILPRLAQAAGHAIPRRP
jgi:DHA1 family inner membrane transport protein